MPSTEEGRNGALSWCGTAWRAAAIWLPVSLTLLVIYWQALGVLGFQDADDALRLVQVRDLLAGQSWFDLHQYRSDVPDGAVLMHWSRLVDLPIAAIILLARPFFGQAGAETLAVVAVPLATLFIALFLIGRLAGRLAGREAVGAACFVAGVSLMLLAQMRPLRIDHHGWQVVCSLLAVNALFARNARPAGWLAGFALAAGLAISMEGLPLTVAMAAVAAWRWLRDPAERAWCVTLVQGLAGGSLLLFLTTRGLADLALHCDAVAPVHLAIFAWGAAALTVLGLLPRQTRPVILGGFAATAAVGLAILALAAPICLHGGFAQLPPSLHETWLIRVPEGRPVWEKSWSLALQIALPLVIALWAAVRMAMAAQGAERGRRSEFAALLLAAIVLAVIVTRANATAQALAAVPLGWIAMRWIAALRAGIPLHRGLGLLLALIATAFPSVPATLLTAFVPPGETDAERSAATLHACGMEQGFAALSRLPRGEILAPLDMSAHLLMGTPHTVVATAHHRAVAGMLFERAVFTASPDRAHAMLKARGTTYLALCRNMHEPAYLAMLAPHGLDGYLLAGDIPAWLEPVPVVGAGPHFRFWRIR